MKKLNGTKPWFAQIASADGIKLKHITILLTDE
jgi:hypothetical protein